MIDSLLVGLFQFDVLWEDIHGNQSFIENYLAAENVLPDIIVLPEMFTTGFTMAPGRLDIKILNGQLAWLQKVAEKFQVGILGSIVVKEGKSFFNRAYFINSDKTNSHYDKRHLFSIGGEHKIFEQGNIRQIFDYRGIKICPQICYDLRFPVWSRNTDGYHVLINVANWPVGRQIVWETLLRARAIENQCYVVGVNRIGKDGNQVSYAGGSAVFSPGGKELIRMGQDFGLQTVKLDMSDLIAFKEKFPAYLDADCFQIKNRN